MFERIRCVIKQNNVKLIVITDHPRNHHHIIVINHHHRCLNANMNAENPIELYFQTIRIFAYAPRWLLLLLLLFSMLPKVLCAMQRLFIFPIYAECSKNRAVFVLCLVPWRMF